MTVKSLLIKIGADASELQAGLDKAKKGLEAHEAAFKKVGLTMTAVGSGLTAFFMKAVKEAAGQEAANVKLETALKNVKTASEGGARMLIQYAGALQKTTGYADEEIVSAQAMLATFQLNEKQIAAITPRLLDMAAATEKATGEHQDLQTIAIALGKGFTGTAAGLSRYGVVLSDEAKKTGDFNSILKSLDMNFKGAAEAAGKTFSGQLKILKANLNETMETIGTQLIPVLVPLIQKISAAVTSVAKWADAHKGLLSTLVPIVAGLSAAMTVLGPMTMVLPKIVGAVLGLSKALLFLAANPAALAFAAMGALAIVIYRLTSAMKEAAGMEGVFNEANKALMANMMEAGQICNMTAQEFMNLEKKYQRNAIRMKEAMLAGKEGKALQEQLIFVLKKHGETIDEQGQAYDQSRAELDKFLEEVKKLNSAAKIEEEQAKKIIGVRAQLTDEIAKATMKERDYQKFAITAAYEQKKAAIQMEITDEKSKGELLLQAAQSRDAQLAALEKQYRDEELVARIEFAKMIADQEDAQTVARVEALKAFAAQKQTIQDGINQLTMTGLQYKLLALDQERQAEEKRIKESTELTAAQKEELLKLLAAYYEKKGKLEKDDAEGWLQQIKDTEAAITNVLGNFFSNTLDAFRKWGEGGGSILKTLGEAFKSMVGDALSALRDLVTGTMLASLKQIIQAKAVAVANVIKSVMASIPFPLNLALVGGAIAAVSALFSRIKLGEGGIVTGPTLAMIGERGPEAVIPLDRPGALAGAGVTLQQSNYFYGDIRSDQDIEEISRRLAERTIQAISRGRRP